MARARTRKEHGVGRGGVERPTRKSGEPKSRKSQVETRIEEVMDDNCGWRGRRLEILNVDMIKYKNKTNIHRNVIY